MSIAALLTFVAAIASCSSGGEGWQPCPVRPGDIPHPAGATDVVFQLRNGGGLPPPAFMPDDLPELTVYGDGRGLMVDPTGPSGRIEALLEVRLTEDELQHVLHAAEPSCMLERDQVLDMPGVYDVPGTVFTATTDGVEHRTLAVALGIDALASNVPEGQSRQRELLMELAREARREVTAGAGADAVPYEIERLGVFFEQLPAPPTQSDAPSVIWPLEEPLATFGRASPPAYPDVHCAVTTGRAIGDVLSALDGIPAGSTPYWRDGSAWYELALRPMLPHEADCAALVS